MKNASHLVDQIADTNELRIRRTLKNTRRWDGRGCHAGTFPADAATMAEEAGKSDKIFGAIFTISPRFACSRPSKGLSAENIATLEIEPCCEMCPSEFRMELRDRGRGLGRGQRLNDATGVQAEDNNIHAPVLCSPLRRFIASDWVVLRISRGRQTFRRETVTQDEQANQFGCSGRR